MIKKNTQKTKADKHLPVRMCTICRKKFLKNELLRFALDCNGALQEDVKKIFTGRGCYVCTESGCRKKWSSRISGRQQGGLGHE